jgi:putative PIN family toxin of toxin-antitoxin system
MIVVVDTNVFVSALIRDGGASRQIIRLCLTGEIVPLMGNALFSEFEDVCARDELFDAGVLSLRDRHSLMDAFFSVCIWTPIYFLWRPNLRDEADNHLIELAVAGNAKAIITANKRDFLTPDLNFPEIEICNASEFLKTERPRKWAH